MFNSNFDHESWMGFNETSTRVQRPVINNNTSFVPLCNQPSVYHVKAQLISQQTFIEGHQH